MPMGIPWCFTPGVLATCLMYVKMYPQTREPSSAETVCRFIERAVSLEVI
jgi:hypothetical protein